MSSTWATRKRHLLRRRERVCALPFDARTSFRPEWLEPRLLLSGIITGTVYDDHNGDGSRAFLETGIGGVMVFLDQDGDGVYDEADEVSVLTGIDGNYTFTGLAPGTYSVVAVPPAGAAQTAPAAVTHTVTLTDGPVTNVLLNFQELAHTGSSIDIGPYQRNGFTIDTSVSHPEKFRIVGSGGGILYMGSATLQSKWSPATIFLTKDDGQPFSLTTLNLSKYWDGAGTAMVTFKGIYADGSFVEQRLTLNHGYMRTYTLNFMNVVRVEWGYGTNGSMGHQFDNLALNYGDVTQDAGNVNFGFDRSALSPLGSISGVAFDDLNKNGVRDASEPGIAGAVVFLDEDGDRELDEGTEVSVLTEADGSYTFADLGQGTYSVVIAPIAGGIPTGPSSRARTVRLGTGELGSHVFDFEDLAHTGDSINIDAYQRNGYTISTFVTHANKLVIRGSAGGSRYMGSATLQSVWAPTTIYMVRDDGLPFNLTTMDLSKHWSDSSARTVKFRGFRANGTTVNRTISFSHTGLVNYTLNFTDVIRVEWDFTGFNDYHQFDDVAVNRMDEPTHAVLIDFGIDLPSPPVAVDDVYFIEVNQTLNLTTKAVGPLGNDTDADGDSLFYEFIDGPNNGVFTVNSHGILSFVPDTDYRGVEVFSYRVSDGKGGTDIGQITIRVGVNTPPVAEPDEADAVGGQAKVIDVLANDSDPDGGQLEITSYTQPAHGSVTLNADGTFTYIANAFYTGIDSFTYTLTDDANESATATVTLNVTTNYSPVAGDDDYTIGENQVLVVKPMGISTLKLYSPPGDPVGLGLNYSKSENNGAFTASFSGNSYMRIRYQHDSQTTDWWNLDFDSPTGQPLVAGTYLGATRYPFNVGAEPGLNVSGQGRGVNTLTGFFTVYDILIDPSGAVVHFKADFSQSADGDKPPLTGVVDYIAQTHPASYLANDVGLDNDELHVEVIQNVAHGTLDLRQDGSFVYTPDLGFEGVDSFVYGVTDGLVADVATVTITVVGRNFAPIGLELSASTVGEELPIGTLVAILTAIDTDIGDTHTFSLVSGGGSTDNAKFQIVGNELRTKVVLDFETKSALSIRLRVTDQLGAPFTTTRAITVVDRVEAAPVVTGIYLDSSAWSPAYRDHLAQAGAGAAAGVTLNSGETQLDTIPFINVDRIAVRFSEPVTVVASHLSLLGVETSSVSWAGFSYDQVTLTATWTLGAALAADAYRMVLGDAVTDLANTALDGDWIDGVSASSGDGGAGGALSFRFNVLPGDADRSGTVTADDFALIRQSQFRGPGSPGYNLWLDLDGSAGIFVDDVIHSRNRQNSTVPAGQPPLSPGEPMLVHVPPRQPVEMQPDFRLLAVAHAMLDPVRNRQTLPLAGVWRSTLPVFTFRAVRPQAPLMELPGLAPSGWSRTI